MTARTLSKAAPAASPWMTRLCLFGFFLLLALQLVPIWAVDYLPTQDGPWHLYTGYVLKNYSDPDLSAIRNFFVIDLKPLTNLFVPGVLYLLLDLASPEVAEKLLVSLYLLIFPFAAYFAVRPLTFEPWFAVFLLVPLANGLTFHIGLYNYSFGFVFLLVALGLYLRADATPSVWRYTALALASALSFYTHIFPTVGLLALVGLSAFWRCVSVSWASWRATGDGEDMLRSRLAGHVWSAVRRHGLYPFFALLPTALLVLQFVLNHAGSGTYYYEDQTLLYRVYRLLAATSVYALTEWDRLLGMIYAGVIFVLAVRVLQGQAAKRSSKGSGPLLFASLALMAIYFVVPTESMGGTLILARYIDLIFVAMVLWLATTPIEANVRRGTTLAMLVYCLALPLIRLPDYLEISDYRTAYLDAGRKAVSAGQTILNPTIGPTLSFDGTGTAKWIVNPMQHIAAYLAIEKNGVLLNIRQAHSVHFPLRYREHLDPYFHLSQDGEEVALAQVPPRIDLQGYLTRTGARVDYVIFWGEPTDIKRRVARDLLRQFENGYEKVLHVPHPGPLTIMRHRQVSLD